MDIDWNNTIKKEIWLSVINSKLGKTNRIYARKTKVINLTNNREFVKDYLINNGYDEVYGARPLKRFVQKKLETLIAKNILANKILPNTTITVDCKDDELFIK